LSPHTCTNGVQRIQNNGLPANKRRRTGVEFFPSNLLGTLKQKQQQNQFSADIQSNHKLSTFTNKFGGPIDVSTTSVPILAASSSPSSQTETALYRVNTCFSTSLPKSLERDRHSSASSFKNGNFIAHTSGKSYSNNTTNNLPHSCSNLSSSCALSSSGGPFSSSTLPLTPITPSGAGPSDWNNYNNSLCNTKEMISLPTSCPSAPSAAMVSSANALISTLPTTSAVQKESSRYSLGERTRSDPLLSVSTNSTSTTIGPNGTSTRSGCNSFSRDIPPPTPNSSMIQNHNDCNSSQLINKNVVPSTSFVNSCTDSPSNPSKGLVGSPLGFNSRCLRENTAHTSSSSIMPRFNHGRVPHSNQPQLVVAHTGLSSSHAGSNSTNNTLRNSKNSSFSLRGNNSPTTPAPPVVHHVNVSGGLTSLFMAEEPRLVQTSIFRSAQAVASAGIDVALARRATVEWLIHVRFSFFS
jgi:hypothetical protein